jgi:hypothetical protein
VRDSDYTATQAIIGISYHRSATGDTKFNHNEVFENNVSGYTNKENTTNKATILSCQVWKNIHVISIARSDTAIMKKAVSMVRKYFDRAAVRLNPERAYTNAISIVAGIMYCPIYRTT